MFQLLQLFIHLFQPFLVPVCFLSAWTIVILIIWSSWTAIRDTVAQTQQMHRIPCADCQFFTSDYHLKCTVHPSTALTEDAIDCLDYEPAVNSYNVAQTRIHR